MKAGKLKDLICVVCKEKFPIMNLTIYTCYRDCISSNPDKSNKLCSKECAKIHEEEYHSSIDIT